MLAIASRRNFRRPHRANRQHSRHRQAPTHARTVTTNDKIPAAERTGKLKLAPFGVLSSIRLDLLIS